MGQRNMIYTGPILETEHGEPFVIPSFPNPNNNNNNNHTIIPPPNFNPQHLPENHGQLPHGITQFNGSNVFMTPSGARVFPIGINHGINQDQLPFSSGINDGLNNGGAFKRKNVHYFYHAGPTEGSSSGSNSGGGVHRSDVVPLVMEGGGGVHRSGRIRVDHGLTSHLIGGNYGGGQPIQGVPNPWLDQQFCGGIPYLQGPINGGGYQVTSNNRNPAPFVGPTPMTPHQGPHNLHHPPPPMPPMQGHNLDFLSQLASTSRRIPTNGGTTSYNPFQNGIEPLTGPRFVGPTPPTGLRVYRPHRREMMVETTARHYGFPHLRVLPEDGVAILDISGYHEVGHSIDHHRDMRLDIDHMSYEELLALGEQIGSVGSGLSDDFILKHLKTRLYASSKSSSSDALSTDQELNSCVICQTNYDNEDQIGVLDCGHEYHVECVKKWLIMKNTCPVCKSTALSQTKES